MNPLEWLLWFLLPGDSGGLGLRRQSIDGTRRLHEGRLFMSVVQAALGLTALVVAFAAPALGLPGLADHPVATTVVAVTVAVLIFTVAPGVSALRGAGRRESSRWPRRGR